MSIRKIAICLAGLVCLGFSTSSMSASGDLLGTVFLPNDIGSHGGAVVPDGHGGVYYVAHNGFPLGNVYNIYSYTSALGAQTATLVATKNLVDETGAPLLANSLTCDAWDPTRSLLWAGSTGGDGKVYTIDLGDMTASGQATATFQFDSIFGDTRLCSGMAYDPFNDSLWVTAHEFNYTYEFGLGGQHGFGEVLGSVNPDEGSAIPAVFNRGVVVGSAEELYVSSRRVINRVDKATGAYLMFFYLTEEFNSDLVCDTVTFAPLTVLLAKQPDVQSFAIFELEEGVCAAPAVEATMPVPLLDWLGLLLMVSTLGLVVIWVNRHTYKA